MADNTKVVNKSILIHGKLDTLKTSTEKQLSKTEQTIDTLAKKMEAAVKKNDVKTFDKLRTGLVAALKSHEKASTDFEKICGKAERNMKALGAAVK